MKSPLVASALCLLALAVVGCGDEAGAPEETRKAIPTQSGIEARSRREPEAKVPAHLPVEKLTVVDVIEGEGPAAGLGDELAVHYVAVHIDGEFFEDSWDQAYRFELGPETVVPGWEKGLVGMRVGGRRKLVIQPPLTSRVLTARVPVEEDPDGTLVYVIDLLGVNPG